MTSPAAAYPELTQALAAALGFRPEDLDANRSGRLARRQRLTLLLVYAAYAGLTVVFPLGLLTWLLAQPGPAGSELWIVFLCVALPLLALGGLSLWNARRLLRDVLGGVVAQQVGQARKGVVTRTLRGRSDTRYSVQFETRVFEIPRAAFEALQAGRVYRAYYLPGSGRLVSVEAIG
jgi:hypothetical protein